MLRKFDVLPTLHMDHESQYAHPPRLPEVCYLEDAALSVMFDLKTYKAATILKNDTLKTAKDEMDMMHVNTLIAINDKDELVGLINANDIMGNKTFIFSEEKRVKRAEIKVQDIMTPYNELLALNYSDVKVAEVSNIVTTLNHHHQSYAIVIDLQNDKPVIRGFFTRHHLSKVLGKDISKDIDSATSLAELQHHIKE